MNSIPLRKTPLTAAQYLNHCQARRNRQACAWIDFKEASFRLACYSVATVALVIVGVNLIFSFLPFIP